MLELVPGEDIPGAGDAVAEACGHYVTYEWFGENDVYFEIKS